MAAVLGYRLRLCAVALLGAGTLAGAIALALPVSLPLQFAGPVPLAAVSEARAFAAANSDPRRLDEAARLTRQTLALKPADATAWARLAWIASERGQSAEMADALDRSYGVAPFGPEITGWRLRFVYSQWSSLPPALRQQAAAELAVTARTRPRLARAVLADISHPAGRLAFTLRLRRAERERALATAT